MINEVKREEIALFRYGMILPFLPPGQLEWGLKGELRRRLAQKHINIPHSKKHRVCEDTIGKWLAACQAKGFEGLKPQGRSDHGHTRKIPTEIFEQAVALKKEHRSVASPRLSTSWKPAT